MKMKSIRLDFPAENLSINNGDLLCILRDALQDKARTTSNLGVMNAAIAMSHSVANSDVDEYDDRYGGPVFYIP